MNFDLSQLLPYQWILGIISAMITGMSKTGITGMALFFIPLMAIAFGSRESTGIILPMLCVGDIFAVAWYRRHAEVRYIFKLLPSTLCGIMTGAVIGGYISAGAFRIMLGCIISALLLLMIWQDIQKKERLYPEAWWFSAATGFVAGFTTMVGNAAGPVMAVYLLSMRLPKNAYIGTAAWFYMVVNIIKLPLQIFYWKNISFASISFNAVMIPFIALGAFTGYKITGKIPDKAYRIFIFIITGISVIMMFI